MVVFRMARNDGNRSNSRPNRVCWRGYRNRTWSERMHWAWSWSISIGWMSNSCRVSGENRMIAFMQPTSLGSTLICRNRHRISRSVFISVSANKSLGSRSLAWLLSSTAVMSKGTLHWARLSRNNSFHDS